MGAIFMAVINRVEGPRTRKGGGGDRSNVNWAELFRGVRWHLKMRGAVEKVNFCGGGSENRRTRMLGEGKDAMNSKEDRRLHLSVY